MVYAHRRRRRAMLLDDGVKRRVERLLFALRVRDQFTRQKLGQAIEQLGEISRAQSADVCFHLSGVAIQRFRQGAVMRTNRVGQGMCRCAAHQIILSIRVVCCRMTRWRFALRQIIGHSQKFPGVRCSMRHEKSRWQRLMSYPKLSVHPSYACLPPVSSMNFCQSFRKFSMPLSVSGCFAASSSTLNGTVAMSAPALAASMMCSGWRMLAASTKVERLCVR